MQYSLPKIIDIDNNDDFKVSLEGLSDDPSNQGYMNIVKYNSTNNTLIFFPGEKSDVNKTHQFSLSLTEVYSGNS